MEIIKSFAEVLTTHFQISTAYPGDPPLTNASEEPLGEIGCMLIAMKLDIELIPQGWFLVVCSASDGPSRKFHRSDWKTIQREEESAGSDIEQVQPKRFLK